VVGLHGDRHQANVRGHGLAQRDVAHTFGVDEDFKAVNFVIEGDDLAGHRDIVSQQRLHGEAHGIDGALAHQNEMLAQVGQFFVKITFHGIMNSGCKRQ
jgi:hypothetical protein